MRVELALFMIGCLLSIAGAQSYGKSIQAQAVPSPARMVLEQMSLTERKNSCISVEFGSHDSEAVLLGHEVERFWNGARYDEALVQLDSLEARVGHVAIGNSWREPVPTLQTSLWGSDVRIGNRDSLLDLAFDTDPTTGNFFVALRHNSTAPHLSVCMSTDGGATWNETFIWSGSPPTAIDAGVTANHFYVVYNSPVDDPEHLRMRRFRCIDGRSDTLPGGGAWVAPCTLAVGTTMREVSLAPDQSGGWLYLYTLASDGSVLKNYWYEGAGSWSSASTGITSGANNGIDAVYNQGAESTSLFLSYHDVRDTLRIYGGSKLRFSLFAGKGTPTSISAYRDKIFCTFEDQTSSPSQVWCVANSGDSDTWRLTDLSSTDTAAEAPAVVVGGNGMVAAVYRHGALTRELRFRQRTYTGPWSEPITIAEHEPYWNRPEIRCLSASGAFGVAYLSSTGQVVRGAYFDRSDWLYCIAELRRLLEDDNTLSVFPNPLSGHGRLTYTLNCAAHLRLQAYNRAGSVVQTLFDAHSPAGRQSLGFDATGMTPGVYFIRAEADGKSLTVPVTVVR